MMSDTSKKSHFVVRGGKEPPVFSSVSGDGLVFSRVTGIIMGFWAYEA